MDTGTELITTDQVRKSLFDLADQFGLQRVTDRCGEREDVLRC